MLLEKGEVRCADEALSRADTALRQARDDAAALEEAVASRDVTTMGAALDRLRLRAAGSREAEMAAISCSLPQAVRVTDHTLVTVVVDGLIARVEP